jgi:hypothetical protein
MRREALAQLRRSSTLPRRKANGPFCRGSLDLIRAACLGHHCHFAHYPRLADRCKGFRDSFLGNLSAAAGGRFSLGLSRYIAEGNYPGQTSLLIKDRKPPHAIVTHHRLGLTDTIAGMTGNHVLRHGGSNRDSPELIALCIRGHRDIAIGDNADNMPSPLV